jgi:predicted nucleic acid-binding protein
VAGPRYLVDTSVLSRLAKAVVAARFTPLATAGAVAVCAPVAFEVGFSARTAADNRLVLDQLASFPHAPTTDGDHQRALGIQAALAERGEHRSLSLVDALVASVAETRDLTILHYDADFETIGRVTHQAQEWVVARGTAD